MTTLAIVMVARPYPIQGEAITMSWRTSTKGRMGARKGMRITADRTHAGLRPPPRTHDNRSLAARAPRLASRRSQLGRRPTAYPTSCPWPHPREPNKKETAWEAVRPRGGGWPWREDPPGETSVAQSRPAAPGLGDVSARCSAVPRFPACAGTRRKTAHLS